MKTCPKCRGKYPDDITQCSECAIELIDNKEFNIILHELYDMNLEQRQTFKNNYRYELVYKYQFGNKEIKNIKTIHTNKIQSKQHLNNLQSIPKCPTCGSTKIRRISTLNHTISIAVFGLFSSKIGKNYECLNCKAKW